MLNLIAVCLTVIAKLFSSNLKFDFNFLVTLGLYTYTIFLYLLVMIFWEAFPLAYLWFIPIPISALLVKPFKSVIYWTVIIIILSLSAPVVSSLLSELLGLDITINFSKQLSIVVNISVFIFSVFLVLLLLYYHNLFNTLNVKRLEIVHSKAIEKSSLSLIVQKKDFLKFESLFNEIEHFVNIERPYQSPNYNINNLAIDLKSNGTYISKAIKQKNGLSFNNYINECRIKEVKEKLIKHEHEQFTLHHIFTNAGFTHQSTFNRVFKTVEGVTPSEFIAKLEK